jgi:hypothetical protein
MTITEARAWLRNFATDSDSTRYDTTILDQAIQFAGNEFCRRTRAVRKVQTISFTASDDTPDVSAAVTAYFRPERLIDLFIVGEVNPLAVVDYVDLNQWATEDATEGVPRVAAFLDATTMYLWPTPDTAYTAKLRFWQPFTAWTPGAADGSATLNLPDDYLHAVLNFGAAAVLKSPAKEQAFASKAWEQFEKYVQQFKGAGTVGARVVYLDRLT